MSWATFRGGFVGPSPLAALAVIFGLSGPPACIGATPSEVKERFETARDAASESFQSFKAASAPIHQIELNEASIRDLEDGMTNRGREIGALGLQLEQLDAVGPRLRNSAWRDQRRTVHGQQLELRNVQQEARRQVELLKRDRVGPAKKKEALAARDRAMAELGEKVDDLRSALDEVNKLGPDGFGLEGKEKKEFSTRVSEARKFVKDVEPNLKAKRPKKASKPG